MARKNTCGNLIASSCVPFTGKDLTFKVKDPQLECDANMDDVIEKISIAIDDLQKATDVSLVVSDCFTVSTPTTITSYANNIKDKLCALDAQLQALVQQVANQNIATELINIDLGCLAPAAAPCQVSTNMYTLISILTLYKSEICAIKEHLGI